MARKPAHLQAQGKLTPRERIWAAIRGPLKKCFASPELIAHLRREGQRVDETTVRAYLDGLCAATPPFLVLRPDGIYVLQRDTGVDAPRVTSEGREVTQGRGTLALWRAMRIHKQFDYRELAAFASTDTLRVAPNTTRTYCQFLARADYLQIVRPSKPGTPARYRLAKYTGPKAPMIQRVKHLYDPNLGEVVWHPSQSAVSV